jgi:hypothetical protein
MIRTIGCRSRRSSRPENGPWGIHRAHTRQLVVRLMTLNDTNTGDRMFCSIGRTGEQIRLRRKLKRKDGLGGAQPDANMRVSNRRQWPPLDGHTLRRYILWLVCPQPDAREPSLANRDRVNQPQRQNDARFSRHAVNSSRCVSNPHGMAQQKAWEEIA